jgi:hypothetical protein
MRLAYKNVRSKYIWGMGNKPSFLLNSDSCRRALESIKSSDYTEKNIVEERRRQNLEKIKKHRK